MAALVLASPAHAAATLLETDGVMLRLRTGGGQRERRELP